jgi:hypothetical protein
VIEPASGEDSRPIPQFKTLQVSSRAQLNSSIITELQSEPQIRSCWITAAIPCLNRGNLAEPFPGLLPLTFGWPSALFDSSSIYTAKELA